MLERISSIRRIPEVLQINQGLRERAQYGLLVLDPATGNFNFQPLRDGLNMEELLKKLFLL